MPRKPIEKKCVVCGKKYKTPHPQEQIYCSRACFGKVSSEEKKGKKNPNWNGGTSTDFYLRIARESLIQKCSLCDSTKFLCVHHKDENRANNKLDNLIVVCKSCHAKIHKIDKNFKQ